MAVTDPWLLVACITATIGLLGVTSGLINARLWISEPLACLALGIGLGPACFGLLRVDVGTDPHAAVFLREIARATLAVSVTAAGMRLPRGWLALNWRGLAVALGPGMLAMWGASSGLGLLLGAPWPVCLLIGAVITPTDPVLSAPILTGRLARQAVPADLRHALTAESGANDGLVAPLIAAVLVLAVHGSGATLVGWFTQDVLWGSVVSVGGGALAGWLAGRALNWAERRPDADPAPLLTTALALAALVLAVMQVLGGNGVLAAFIAGAVLNEAVGGEREQRQEHFNEGFSRFFDLPIMVLFGAALPWVAWRGLGWRAAVFAVCVMLFRRLPIWLLLGGAMPWTRSRPEALFAGWFGPIGAAALFYACDIQAKAGPALIWTSTSLVIFASVIAHGITGTPLTHGIGRALRSTPKRAFPI